MEHILYNTHNKEIIFWKSENITLSVFEERQESLAVKKCWLGSRGYESGSPPEAASLGTSYLNLAESLILHVGSGDTYSTYSIRWPPGLSDDPWKDLTMCLTSNLATWQLLLLITCLLSLIICKTKVAQWIRFLRFLLYFHRDKKPNQHIKTSFLN